MYKYLLIGNPNVGKSSFFNSLTKSNVTVGNWSGVTVEEKLGRLYNNKEVEIYDLPGVYSLIPSSMDEGVVSRLIQHEEFNGILNIVDATALKRNLHLTIQILEMGFPTVLALNMMDELKLKGLTINTDKMGQRLGIQVIPTIASKREGIEEVTKNLPKNNDFKLEINYGEILEEAIKKIKKLLPHNKFRRRFLAIQILDGNEEFQKYIKQFGVYQEVMDVVKDTKGVLDTLQSNGTITQIMFEKRIELITSILNECVESTGDVVSRNETSLKMDRILLNQYLGFPIFFAILMGMYFLTFNILGNPISDFLDYLLVEYVTKGVASFNEIIGITGFLNALILDGIIAGVGQVVVFIPQITILFFLLTLLEGTGYMARVTILFDRFFSKFDLNGKAVVPLVTGMGCNVPAVMSTRTMVDKKDRLLTMLIIPFMSCSARIPIYVVFSAAFFKESAWFVMFFMQLLGAIVALVSAKILSTTLFKKSDSYFALEVPPYRTPQLKNVIRVTIAKGKDFIHGAGKFILIGSIVIWILNVFGPTGYNVSSDENFLSLFGGWIAPLFIPLGFGNWQSVSAIISGFLAKELVVSSMGVLYGSTDASVIQNYFTNASAISFMVFNLLYIPCLATVMAIYNENKSIRWTLTSIMYSTIVAYIIAWITYNIALILF